MSVAHIQEPREDWKLDGASHYRAGGVPGDGPFVETWFLVEGGRIERCIYKTNRCPTSIGSSIVTELLHGKPVRVALRIDEADIFVLIGRCRK